MVHERYDSYNLYDFPTNAFIILLSNEQRRKVQTDTYLKFVITTKEFQLNLHTTIFSSLKLKIK